MSPAIRRPVGVGPDARPMVGCSAVSATVWIAFYLRAVFYSIERGALPFHTFFSLLVCAMDWYLQFSTEIPGYIISPYITPLEASSAPLVAYIFFAYRHASFEAAVCTHTCVRGRM